MNCLCSSETFLLTLLLISPDLDGRSVFFWDIPINTTTNFTWSTRWTVFVLLRHCYQHHYWSHLTYKMDCLCTSETFLSTPLLISPDLQDEFLLYFWDIPINTTTDIIWSTRWTVLYFWDILINTTTDLTWSTLWTVFVLLRHFYQHHYWSHLIYEMNCLCSSEAFLSTPLLISPDLQDGMSLYFWDIHINNTTDLTWSTIWTVFVLLRHSDQHYYSSHLIYNMDGLCTSETFISTPLLISNELQDELALYFWDIHINTTTHLTWSTISTFFVLLRHFYQYHYWSHLIYKMNCLSTSETLLSTPLLISPDLQDRRSLYFWDIPIKTTTDLTWSTRWTGFVLLRHSYQHHYWSQMNYKMNWLCTSETFISTPLLISPDLQYRLSLYFWDISINTTTDLTWSTRWTVFLLLRHCYQHHYWSHLIYKMDWLCTSETLLSTPLLISTDLQDRLSLYFWDIPINTTADLTWSTRWTGFVLLQHCYQHHYWSHLINKMNCLCTSETFLSTPLFISPDLQDELSLFFWEIPINTTTDLTWSTRWTVFVLLRHSYQHHYWSHLM